MLQTKKKHIYASSAAERTIWTFYFQHKANFLSGLRCPQTEQSATNYFSDQSSSALKSLVNKNDFRNEDIV